MYAIRSYYVHARELNARKPVAGKSRRDRGAGKALIAEREGDAGNRGLVLIADGAAREAGFEIVVVLIGRHEREGRADRLDRNNFV